MSKKIDTVYNEDPSAGNDPSTNYKIAASDGTTTPVALDMDQTAAAVAVRIGTSPPPQPTEDLKQFVATIQDNSLTANIGAISNIAYTHYLIKEDDATQPTSLPTTTTDGEFTKGTFPSLYYVGSTPSVAEDWSTTTILYPWLYDVPTATLKKLLTLTGIHGVSITPNATVPPSAITDFTVDTVNTTDIEVSFSASSTIDNADLQYDIIDISTDTTLAEDVTPGTVSVTGLSPSTDYLVAVKVWVTTNIDRSYTSVGVATTTDATAITFTNLVLSDDGDQDNATITTFTSSGADQWYWSLTDVAPTSGSTWITSLPTPGVTKISIGSAGLHQVFAWVRLLADPTNIVPLSLVGNNYAEVTIAPAAGSDIWSIKAEASSLVINEDGQPTGNITIQRGSSSGVAQTIDIQSTDISAIAGENYKRIDETVSFGAGDTEKTINWYPLYRNLGHDNGVRNTVTFSISLLNASAGTINSTTGEDIVVTIRGTNGYHADGTLDVNAPASNLRTREPNTLVLSGTNTETIDFTRYYNDGLTENTIVIANGAANKTIENNVIGGCRGHAIRFLGWAFNIKIRNNYFVDWAMGWKDGPVSNYDVYAIYAYPQVASITNELDDLVVTNNRSVGHGSFMRLMYTRNSDSWIIEHNHHTNTSNRDLGISRDEYRNLYGDTNPPGAGLNDGSFLLAWSNRGGNHRVRHNVCRNLRYGSVGGHGLDPINFGDGQPSGESQRNFVEFNFIRGSSNDHEGSAVGLQFNDKQPSGEGFLSCNWNICYETQNAGLSIGGQNGYAQENWICMPQASPETHGVGIIYSDNILTPGCELKDNQVLWYGWNGTSAFLNTSFKASEATGPSITGVGTTVVRTDWNADDGYSVRELKAVLSNGGWGDGFNVICAGADSTPGDYILRWDGTSLYLSAFGESEGAAAAINKTPSGSDDLSEYESAVLVYSSNTDNYLYVAVDPTTVSAAGATSYIVKVTNLPVLGSVLLPAYNQTTGSYETGRWAGTDEVSVSGTAPDVPSGFTVTGTATTIDLDWDDESASGAASYRVYRDNVLIASPVDHQYSDNTAVVGISYNYQVASASGDTPPILSDRTEAKSGSLLTSGGTFLPDLDTWTTNNCTVTDNGDGTYTLTNGSGGTAGFIYTTVTPGGGAGSYDVVFSHFGGSTVDPPWKRGLIVIDDTANPPATTGDMLDEYLNSSTLTEYTRNVTTSDGTFYIRLGVGWATNGEFTMFSNVTVD